MSIPKNKWQPKLDKKCTLKGPYPEVIDLCSESPIELNFDLDPKIMIATDECVKKIVAPSDQIGISFISINDLPNLEEIVIEGESSKFSKCLQWVEIENCPSLKKISLKGDVVSLMVTGSSSLEFLDARGCRDIDHVEINHPKHGFKIDVRGCIKLREVIGFDDEISESSGLRAQVLDNQKLSMRDGSIYESMTFTDIAIVNKIINDGVKALSRMGKLYDDERSILGYYGLKALDKEFVPFDYRILMPLEPVYTGGTGETYAYVSRQSEIEPDGIRICQDEVAGNASPEECLKYTLHTISMRFSHISPVDLSTNDELLDLLRNASEINEGEKHLGIPIFISSFMDSEKKAELIELALEAGIKIATDMDAVYAFINPAEEITPEEENIRRSALFSLDVSSALDQLKSAWYWRYTGKTICLSGKAARGNKKKEYESIIKSSDFKLVNEIRRGLSYLVNDAPESTIGKVAQAKKLGIKVISEEELQSMLRPKDLSS